MDGRRQQIYLALCFLLGLFQPTHYRFHWCVGLFIVFNFRHWCWSWWARYSFCFRRTHVYVCAFTTKDGRPNTKIKQFFSVDFSHSISLSLPVCAWVVCVCICFVFEQTKFVLRIVWWQNCFCFVYWRVRHNRRRVLFLFTPVRRVFVNEIFNLHGAINRRLPTAWHVNIFYVLLCFASFHS